MTPVLELRGIDMHYGYVRALDGIEIGRRAQARAGPVLAPFMSRKTFVRVKAAGPLERLTRGPAGTALAMLINLLILPLRCWWQAYLFRYLVSHSRADTVLFALDAELARQRGQRTALVQHATSSEERGHARDLAPLLATAGVLWLESGEPGRARRLVDRLAPALGDLPRDADWLLVVCKVSEAMFCWPPKTLPNERL